MLGSGLPACTPERQRLLMSEHSPHFRSHKMRDKPRRVEGFFAGAHHDALGAAALSACGNGTGGYAVPDAAPSQ